MPHLITMFEVLIQPEDNPQISTIPHNSRHLVISWINILIFTFVQVLVEYSFVIKNYNNYPSKIWIYNTNIFFYLYIIIIQIILSFRPNGGLNLKKYFKFLQIIYSNFNLKILFFFHFQFGNRLLFSFIRFTFVYLSRFYPKFCFKIIILVIIYLTFV